MKGKGFEELTNFSPFEQGRVGKGLFLNFPLHSGKCDVLNTSIMSSDFFSRNSTCLLGNNSEP